MSSGYAVQTLSRLSTAINAYMACPCKGPGWACRGGCAVAKAPLQAMQEGLHHGESAPAACPDRVLYAGGELRLWGRAYPTFPESKLLRARRAARGQCAQFVACYPRKSAILLAAHNSLR